MEEYKKFAIRVAKEAGQIMKEYFAIGMARAKQFVVMQNKL
ncbi:MAG: hypothetical protein AAB661_00590 [Patescibacteria group bacterium]